MKIITTKGNFLKQMHAIKELSGTLALNYSYVWQKVQERNIDAHAFMLELDAETDILKRTQIGFKFMRLIEL
jgi:hypothetical protein